jgi:hypothetical protein
MDLNKLLGENDDAFNADDHQEQIDWSKVKVTKGGIPAGAKRVHLYPVQNVLRPRGPLQKESVSGDLLEKLKSTFESWSDSSYGDIPPTEKLISVMKQNLDDEVKRAWEAFLGN